MTFPFPRPRGPPLPRTRDPAAGAPLRRPEDKWIEIKAHHHRDPREGVDLDRGMREPECPHEQKVQPAGMAEGLDPAQRADVGRGGEGEEDHGPEDPLAGDIGPGGEPGKGRSRNHGEERGRGPNKQGVPQGLPSQLVPQKAPVGPEGGAAGEAEALEEEQDKGIGEEEKQQGPGEPRCDGLGPLGDLTTRFSRRPSRPATYPAGPGRAC